MDEMMMRHVPVSEEHEETLQGHKMLHDVSVE
jgi:hypothetical protein